jgi:hypothetical protein
MIGTMREQLFTNELASEQYSLACIQNIQDQIMPRLVWLRQLIAQL